MCIKQNVKVRYLISYIDNKHSLLFSSKAPKNLKRRSHSVIECDTIIFVTVVCGLHISISNQNIDYVLSCSDSCIDSGSLCNLYISLLRCHLFKYFVYESDDLLNQDYSSLKCLDKCHIYNDS